MAMAMQTVVFEGHQVAILGSAIYHDGRAAASNFF